VRLGLKVFVRATLWGALYTRIIFLGAKSQVANYGLVEK
ncbi:uncharacterized protein METZ01_LOCUS509649, partial [marine metagenome]